MPAPRDEKLWRSQFYYKDWQGVTEQLKAKNQMEWVARMNNIQACAMEIVDKEMIYA